MKTCRLHSFYHFHFCFLVPRCWFYVHVSRFADFASLMSPRILHYHANHKTPHLYPTYFTTNKTASYLKRPIFEYASCPSMTITIHFINDMLMLKDPEACHCHLNHRVPILIPQLRDFFYSSHLRYYLCSRFCWWCPQSPFEEWGRD